MERLRILAAVSFTKGSLHALNYALDLVKHKACDIELIHCISDLVDRNEVLRDFDELTWESERIPLRQELEKKRELQCNALKVELAEKFSQYDFSFTSHIMKGYVDDVIVSYCNSYNPHLIIMGATRVEGSVMELLGSITSDVIARSKAPIIAVPPLATPLSANKSHNILYLTNFKASDFASLHQLIERVIPSGCTIHCAHYCHTRPDKWDESRMNELQQYCTETYRNQAINCSSIIGNNFLESTDKFIATHQIDLIVMTREKRNTISQLFHPDITQKLLFHSHIPLLIFNE
jgi:nucleotide-binding universal stress UspA family protein